MQLRFIPAVAIPTVVAIIGFTRPPTLEAQSAAGAGPSTAATRLVTLSRERAARWAQAAPIITCAPAPLTERPGSAAALARPRVAPLEDAFLDARIVKRTFAVGTRPQPRPFR